VKPIAIEGNLITVEYWGRTLLEYALSDERDETRLEAYLRIATTGKVKIGRRLVELLTEDEKRYLAKRRIGKVSAHFDHGISDKDIVRSFHAFRVMRALNFYDERFIETYSRTMGIYLQELPHIPNMWLKDNFAGNIVVNDGRVASIDFNNVYIGIPQLDDSMLFHSYGLSLSDRAEEMHVARAIKTLGLEGRAEMVYRVGFMFASMHRNILQAGNIIKEIGEGKTGPESVIEAEHYWRMYKQFANRVTGFASRHTNISVSDLGFIQERLDEAYTTQIVSVIQRNVTK